MKQRDVIVEQIRIGKLERLDEKARLTEDFLRDLETNPHPVDTSTSTTPRRLSNSPNEAT